MPETFQDERDPRLSEALSLLEPPVRRPVSAAGPLLAATLLACAGAVLVYLLSLPPETSAPQTHVQSTPARPAQPAFELSASMDAPEDTPPVKDAEIIKDEDAR